MKSCNKRNVRQTSNTRGAKGCNFMIMTLKNNFINVILFVIYNSYQNSIFFVVTVSKIVIIVLDSTFLL